MRDSRMRVKEGFPGQRLVVVPPSIVASALRQPVCRWLIPTHIGRFDHARHHYVERADGTPEHILIVCLEGDGFARIGSKTWPVRQGDAALLPPGRKHRYGADIDRPWSILWVHFSGEGAEDHRHMLLSDEAGPVFPLRDLASVVEAFEEIYRHVLGGYRDADLVGLSTACGRFLGACRLQRGAREGRRRESEERVLRTIRYMRENLARPLLLADLARVSGWAASHFSAVFRKQTNTPPLVFLTRLKLQRACELLKSRESTVAEVAAAVGFDDAFYFSRLFAREIGLPPTTYRKTYSCPFPVRS